jgi:putative ABC transport system permease protein
VGRSFRITTIADQQRTSPRSLATLNLNGLSRIEAIGAALIAAIGVAVLGAFAVLERRREFAILETLGADRSQKLTAPAQEGLIAAIGSLVLGVPIGLGLAMLAVRVLGLFFDLPPPLLSVPGVSLTIFVALVAAASAVAICGALVAVTRVSAASALREP